MIVFFLERANLCINTTDTYKILSCLCSEKELRTKKGAEPQPSTLKKIDPRARLTTKKYAIRIRGMFS